MSDVQGVGKNLQDHFNVSSVFELRDRISMNSKVNNPFSLSLAAGNWVFRKSGFLNSSAAHVVGFARSDNTPGRPDIQFHFLPMSLDSRRRPDKFPAVTIDTCILRPESRGSVAAKSLDVRVHPVIRSNFLAEALDRKVIVDGLKYVRRIVRTEPLVSKILRERAPLPELESDSDLLTFARSTGSTVYHPVGTCRIGADSRSVVDHQLRVRGTENLRVADCSVMPTIISGNTNASAIMIAERAADFILGGHGEDLR